MDEDPAAAYARQVQAQIGQYVDRPIHTTPPAADWLNQRFLTPRLEHLFGVTDIESLYGVELARAAERCGVAEAVSLGAGDATLEIGIARAMQRLGLAPVRITCLELSPVLIERGRAAIAAAGLEGRITMAEADLNRALDRPGPVAAFMAHMSLHHIVGLETLFDSVRDTLHPEGAIVTIDMIGRNGHMRWPETLALLRELWPLLPARLKHDHAFGRPDPWFEDWDCSIEGFEGIRAQDIMDVLGARFAFERCHFWGGLTEMMVSPRFGANFDLALPADRLLLDALQQVEDRLIAGGRIFPTLFAAVLRRPGAIATAPICYAGRHPQRMRRPVDLPPPAQLPSLAEAGFENPYPPMNPPLEQGVARGARIGFGTGQPGLGLLRWGWASPEPPLVWALGLASGLGFAFEAGAPRTLTLETIGFVPGRFAQQQTTVTLNGVTLGQITHRQTGEALTSRFTVPAGAARQGPQRLELHTPTPRRPDLDSGEDQRPLSVALVAMTLT